MRRRTIYFTAPRQVELREEPLPAFGADEVLVETICSAISVTLAMRARDLLIGGLGLLLSGRMIAK